MEEIRIICYGILVVLIVFFSIVVILSIVLKIGTRIRRFLFHLKNDD